MDKCGKLEVICGGMFSGKTEELMRRIRRAQIAHQTVQLFKHRLDTRYSKNEVTDHNGRGVPSIRAARASDISTWVEANKAQGRPVGVIGIDEAQFFDNNLVSVVERLADNGWRIICAGLDIDWQCKPFGPMPELLARAEKVSKLHAICVKCKEPASRSYRVVKMTKQIQVGSTDSYEARCRSCYKKGETV